MFSGWTIPGVPVGAAAPASKWHLRVNLRGSPPVYLNVQFDMQRRRTTITHKAAVRVGQTFHSFYMIFARVESGVVGSLAADGANAIVRADRQRPADPAERGPDMLLDAVGARHKAECLRASGRMTRRSVPKIGARVAVIGQAGYVRCTPSESQDGREWSTGGPGCPTRTPS
jgi:hypothetical protein